MTAKEYADGNIAIAKLMGLYFNGKYYEPITRTEEEVEDKKLDIDVYAIFYGGKRKQITPQYHEMWAWLMPVVEKIESLGGIVTIRGNTCEVQFKFGGIGNHSVFEKKIDAIWNACVEYAKWYKKQ
jgi:hypothetical protein